MMALVEVIAGLATFVLALVVWVLRCSDALFACSSRGATPWDALGHY